MSHLKSTLVRRFTPSIRIPLLVVTAGIVILIAWLAWSGRMLPATSLPHVIEWTPGPVDEVSPETPIVFKFDQPMDVDSVRAAFHLTPTLAYSVTAWVQGDASDSTTFTSPVDVDARSSSDGSTFTSPIAVDARSSSDGSTPPVSVITFTPQPTWDKATRYQVVLDASAHTLTGQHLSDGLSSAFTTTGWLQVQFNPAPDSTHIVTSTNIRISFNAPMSSTGDVPLFTSPEIHGSGQWETASRYVFRPYDLQPATQYSLRVPANLQASGGEKLAYEAVMVFTTTLPGVADYQPRGRLVPPSSVISLKFNLPVDRESVESRLVVLTSNGRPIAGKITWPSSNELAFTPQYRLDDGARYTVRVLDGIRTPLGALPSDRVFEYSFDVLPQPELVSSSPADGDMRALASDRVTLRFNVPMNTWAVERALQIVPAPDAPRFEWNKGGTSLDIVFNIDPTQRYSLVLGDGAFDQLARQIHGNRSIVFQVGPQAPIAWLVGPRGYWNDVYGTYNSNPTVKQYTQFRNVSKLTYRLSSVTQADFLASFDPYWYRDKKPPTSTLMLTWTQVVSAPLNKLAYAPTEVALSDGTPLSPGAYLLQVEGSPGAVKDWRVLIVSPINLALKRSDRQTFVWATDLRTGRPVSGLPLVVYDQSKQVVTRGATDGNGILITDQTEACFDQWECAYGWQPLYVMTDGATSHVSPRSEAEWEWGFVSSNWDEGIATRDFQLPYYYGEPSHTVFLYSDRPIYRPGQMVYFKGVIRQDDDGRYSLPAFDSLTVAIRDAQNNEVYRDELPITDMGTFYGELQLADEAPLGSYTIEAHYAEDEQPAQGSFRVAEYRKPEFKVSVTPAITMPIDGDVLTVTVQADYYFGAPMPNASVEWRMYSDDYAYSLPDAWYSFVDFDEYYWLWGQENNRGESIYANGTGRTDPNGTLTFSVPIDLSKAKRSQVLTFEADVVDQNHQVTSARGYAVAHKSDLYVGVRPRWYVTKPKEFLDIQVVAADPNKNRSPNVPLTVDLYEREWKSVRVLDSYGVYQWQSSYSDTLISTQVITTGLNGEAVAVVSPPRGGSYRVVVRGNPSSGSSESIASTYFWTWGGEYVNWGIQNDDRVNVIADKRSYQPGETARLLITAPFSDSTALVSVERGGVLRYWTIPIQSTSALIEVPIHADYAPNAFVSVILLKSQARDFPAADFKIGYAALNVELTQQQLNVELIPDRTRYAPRDTAVYIVRVTDYLSRPVDAEVSLSLIDAAVLALVGDDDRDILSAFYRQRGLGVHNSLTLVTSVDRLTAILDKKAKGGGGGAEDVATRELFADTAFWRAAVRTGPTGEVTVTVPLPDNLTTWRMRAKAVSADTRLGQSEVDIIATQDILLRPVLPRFFTVGDQAHVGAIVHNYTPLTETLKVLLAVGQDVSLPHNITIGPNASAPVYWDITVPHVLSMTLHLQAVTPDGRGDAVKLTLPVNAFYEDVSYLNYQSITGTQTFAVPLPADVDRARDDLLIEVEPTLAASIDSGLEYLVGFPYGCVEQTMSSFLPDVVVMRLITQAGIDLRPGFREQLNDMIESGLQRLYGYQHNDGGWGWWHDDDSNPSITAYVLFGLHQMELGRRAIDTKRRDAATAYLLNWLKTTAIDAPIGQVHGAQAVSSGVNVRAFALYVLAELGQGDPGLSGRLYEQHAKLDNYGKAYLALALYLTNGRPSVDHNGRQTDARIETLLQELRDAAQQQAGAIFWSDSSNDYYGMSTNARTTAISIDTLARLLGNDPLIDPAVRWLLAQREDGHWSTTQETSMSLIALTEYLMASAEREGEYTYTVRVNGREVATVQVTPQTLGKHTRLLIPLTDLGEGHPVVEITRSAGPGAPLRASVSLRHYRGGSDIAAITDQGVHVARTYTVEGGKPLSDLRVGDIVTVTLSVRYDQPMTYIIVEDPLPAGLEAVDSSLATTAQNLEVGPQPSQRWYGWTWDHVELRDDRVALFKTWMYDNEVLTFTYLARATTAGTFNTLPMQSYAMYNPKLSGRTSGAVVVVK